MSFLGTIGQAAVSSVGDIGGALLNHSLAMRRQEQAQHFESDMYQQRYQMQVKDLMAAGLNPMLAYTTGPGAAPSSGIASAQGADITGAINNWRVTSAQVAKMRADTLVSEETARNVAADTMVKLVTPDLVRAQSSQAKATTSRTRREEQVLRPQAQAALGWTGKAAAIMRNIWDMIGPAADVAKGALKGPSIIFRK